MEHTTRYSSDGNKHHYSITSGKNTGQNRPFVSKNFFYVVLGVFNGGVPQHCQRHGVSVPSGERALYKPIFTL